MPHTRRLEIALPEDLAEMIEEKVASGQFADRSAVIAEGLHVLKDKETSLEQWLRTEVVAAYDEADADPTSLISADELRRQITEWRSR